MGFIHEIGRMLLAKEGKVLNDGQADCLSEFEKYVQAKGASPLFVLKGAAGTGKTFIIRVLVHFLRSSKENVVLLAPTGRAAKVLSARVRMYASTLHRYMYQVEEEGAGYLSFRAKSNKDAANTWYFVDEASMVGNATEGTRNGLLDEWLKFAEDGNTSRRIIFVGDPYQLPPVGATESPALDTAWLESRTGKKPFHFELMEVMRQAEGSGVLGLAETLRDAMIDGVLPEIDLTGFEGVHELLSTGEAVEEFSASHKSGDTGRVAMITYSNFLAVKANLSIRWNLFGSEEPLVNGEHIMVVRNNYGLGDKSFPFIANGELGIVRDVDRVTEEKYGLNWKDVAVEFQDLADNPVVIDGKMVVELLSSKEPNLAYPVLQKIYADRRMEFAEMGKTKMMQQLRKDPYLNVLQAKYGYAITGHKAQGGQWKKVIVVFEGKYKEMTDRDYLRWAYTACTRAEEELYLVNFPFGKK